MDGNAGHFADFLLRERIERGAGDGQIIALDNRKFVDLHFQLFAERRTRIPAAQRGELTQNTCRYR